MYSTEILYPGKKLQFDRVDSSCASYPSWGLNYIAGSAKEET